jgi:hypothetical protein
MPVSNAMLLLIESEANVGVPANVGFVDAFSSWRGRQQGP